MPKYKVGDLVEFLTNVKYGYDFGTRSHVGIITEISSIETSGISGDLTHYKYNYYGQISQQYYWVWEEHIRYPEEGLWRKNA